MTDMVETDLLSHPLSLELQENSMECLHDCETMSDLDVSEFDTCYEEAKWSRNPSAATFAGMDDSTQENQRPRVSTPSSQRILSSALSGSTEPNPLPLVLPSDFQILARHNFNIELHGVMDCKIQPIMQQGRWSPTINLHTDCLHIHDGMKLVDLADDIHLHMLSFLEVSDCRALMATGRRFRALFLSTEARSCWIDFCSKHWPLVTDQLKSAHVVDDLHIPKAASPPSMHVDEIHEQANLALLLSLAERQPTDVDKEQLNIMRGSRRARRRMLHRLLANVGQSGGPMLRHYFDSQLGLSVVKFEGRVGNGDRCVRGNHPLPRPKPNHGYLSSLIPPSNQRNSPRNADLSQMMDIFCRGAKAVVCNHVPTWRPFVAPFLTTPSDSGESSQPTVHLTPRFVSYFEVSILEDKSSEGNSAQNSPAVRNGLTGRQASDCVAIGVATEAFDWHTRMPGWDSTSFGYHGDDGGIFHEFGGMVRQYGPQFGRGDTVGCGVDYAMQGIFFTLNGKFLGYAWTKLSLHLFKKNLYPIVGIDTNDLIHCNYGSEPFVFDLRPSLLRHEELVRQSLSR